MPPRSKVITMLPAYIREEVERRLFENGFRDYEGLAQWVRGQGYEISDDSLWRYGHAIQQQLAAVRLTVSLARALRELAEDPEPLMSQALITIAQQQALATLAEKDEVKPGDLNAIANLTRAAIAQQRWAAQLKAQGERQPHAAAEGKCAPPDKGQPSRNALGSISQLEQGHAATPAASEEPAGHIDRHRESNPAEERRALAQQPPPEAGIAVESNSITDREAAFAATIPPAPHHASPRIAADRVFEGPSDAGFESWSSPHALAMRRTRQDANRRGPTDTNTERTSFPSP
jgi:Protein of unknown function (DUF3486)